MGKSSPNKKKLDAPNSGRIDSFLASQKAPSHLPEPMELKENMADENGSGRPQRERITMQNLLSALSDQRTNILDNISQILSPLKDQISALHKDFQHVAQTAEAALEASVASHEDSRQLQSHERWAKEEIVTLKSKLRDKNIKIRGLAEKAEGNMDLPSFLEAWLATCLKLEDGVALFLLQAYRIGNPYTFKAKGPRDIIMEFADYRTKKAVMDAARIEGGFKFNDSLILFFPDLPPETIQQRKSLRPFAQRLMEANIRYRWSPVGNLSVNSQGKLLQAYDFDSGVGLRALNLDPPPATPDRKPLKRKLELSPSPLKWSKIPILNK